MYRVVFISCGRIAKVRSFAKRLVEEGHTVFCGTSDPVIADELSAFGAVPVDLDVTSENSVADISKMVMKAAGRIDHVFCTSLHNSFGVLEEHDPTDAHYQFYINLFAATRLLRAFGPFLRGQKHGSFTICSAGAVDEHLPTAGWHNACEAATASIVKTAKAEFDAFDVGVNHLAVGFVRNLEDGYTSDLPNKTLFSRQFMPIMHQARPVLIEAFKNSMTAEAFVEAAMSLVNPASDGRNLAASESSSIGWSTDGSPGGSLGGSLRGWRGAVGLLRGLVS